MNNSEQIIYNAILEGNSICTDSREAGKNSLFFALKGDNFDGNNFAHEALNKGCKLAVIDNPQAKIDNRFILVTDVLNTLHNIALQHRNKFNIPVIGITGTNGKTTTKELIYAVLLKKYNTCATKGNLNNHIGVPLTLLSLKKDTEIAVIELGANHVGEIKHLSNLAKPTYGLITNIGKAHLEGFGSIENIIKAKSELYDNIKENKGKLFVNYDNEKLMNLSENIPKITYGKSHNADYIGKIAKNDNFLKIIYSEKKHIHQKYEINTNLIGSYNFENVMAAICIGTFFEVNKNHIKEAIETYNPTNNRSQFIKTKNNTILMDAYNANPSSMKLALEHFHSMNLTNKTVILGDMLELGEDEDKEHSKILDLALKQKFNNIILVGEKFCNVANKEKNVTFFTNAPELINWLIKNPQSNKSILIKGSRGIKLEAILDYL